MNRKCTPSFADLIDNLTVQQIKEVFRPKYIDQYEKEISDLKHDIDIDIEEEDISFCAKVVRLVIVLSQINLIIWHEKEKMKSDSDNYYDHLKLSHRLNGLRNQIRNRLMEGINHQQQDIKTNISVEGLEGWQISL